MLLLSIYALLTKHEVKIAGYWLSPSAHLTPQVANQITRFVSKSPKALQRCNERCYRVICLEIFLSLLRL